MTVSRRLIAFIGCAGMMAAALVLFASALVTVSAAGRPAQLPTTTPTPPGLDGGCTISVPDCGPATSAPSGVELGAPALPTAASTRIGPGRKAILYLFWGDGCPHCAIEKPFLEKLAQQNPQVQVRDYEVWNDEGNRALFSKMAAAYGFEPQAVPTTFLGEQYWIGYTDQMGQEMEKAVLRCLETGCKDAGAGIIAPAELAPEPTSVAPPPASQSTSRAASLELPLIGTVNLEHQSLLVSTILIAFVDGVNPCSLWTLTMLLAITLHTGSRKKVIVIGLVFLTVTAGIYALFIAGLFTVFTFAGFTGWFQIIVALVALLFAAINIKDYFWYKEGISLTIPDEKKPGLLQRMRGLVDASQSFGGLIAATIVMSAGVSLVEFSCTAGFPMLWANLLSTQHVSAVIFLALLAVYMLIYQLDEMGIFFVSVFTLKATRLQEKEGRMLKLIGGMLMLTLAIVMLVNPNLMNNLGSSLLIFGAALGATLLVLIVHRAILPRFGIWIGTEAKSKQAQSGSRRA